MAQYFIPFKLLCAFSWCALSPFDQSSDPADKDAWKDKGMGQLSIKCKEGVTKGTKESKPTIIIRNDVGHIRYFYILNLCLTWNVILLHVFLFLFIGFIWYLGLSKPDYIHGLLLCLLSFVSEIYEKSLPSWLGDENACRLTVETPPKLEVVFCHLILLSCIISIVSGWKSAAQCIVIPWHQNKLAKELSSSNISYFGNAL